MCVCVDVYVYIIHLYIHPTPPPPQTTTATPQPLSPTHIHPHIFKHSYIKCTYVLTNLTPPINLLPPQQLLKAYPRQRLAYTFPLAAVADAKRVRSKRDTEAS